jgi:hypothetical protein
MVTPQPSRKNRMTSPRVARECPGADGAEVEPPFQHRPVDDDRTGEIALHRALPIGAGVDEQGTGRHRGPCLVGFESPHSDPSLFEHRVHSGRRCRHAMILPRAVEHSHTGDSGRPPRQQSAVFYREYVR